MPRSISRKAKLKRTRLGTNKGIRRQNERSGKGTANCGRPSTQISIACESIYLIMPAGGRCRNEGIYRVEGNEDASMCYWDISNLGVAAGSHGGSRLRRR